MKPNDNAPSSIIAQWKKDQNYKEKMRFLQKWPEYVRFKEGDQWPAVTKKTKNFTRITINQCDFVVENKKSNIMSQSLKMIYNFKELPDNADETMKEELTTKTKDFTDLADNTWVDLDQNQLNNDAVDDALTIGTAFYHYYFDSSYVGGQYVKTKGRLCGHTINAADIALGNPQLKPHELQKQPYIIVKTYEDTDATKEYAKKNGENWQLIVSDVDNDEQYDNGKQDIESPNKVVCYTKYFKVNGDVYWTKITQTAIVQTETRLSPVERKFGLYPVEMLVFKPRTKCSYGRGVIEDIISVQKGINFLYSMIAYGVQQTAWPKILAKAGALIQPITNEPGEVITDQDLNNPGDSIKYMQPPNFSNMPPLLIDKLTDSLRQTTGATDVASGESIGANMAAQAIIALQNQAKKPVESYMKQLAASLKRIGKIWEEFFKCFYILPRTVVSTDAKGQKTGKTITPSDYADMEYSLDIDVGAGGEYSEQGQAMFVKDMYDKKDITKYQYIRYSPSSLVPQSMKSDFEEEEQKMLEAQAGADEIMAGLTPDEQAVLAQQPELLNGVMGGGV